MNDWQKAIWMLEEGFTATQLKELEPSDADAWKRLKPLVQHTKKNITLSRKDDRMQLMIDAFNKCKPVKNDWYYTSDVRDAHVKTQATFYKHLKELPIEKKMIDGRAVLYHPSPHHITSGCQGVNNQGKPCKVKHSTAHTHTDECQREQKDFCWMHCDCSHCSQLMNGAVKTQGQYYKEMKQ